MLRTDQLLLLENMTYFNNTQPFKTILYYQGQTVAQTMDQIDLSLMQEGLDYGFGMRPVEWINLINAICLDDTLMAIRIAAVHMDIAEGGGGGISAVFIDDAAKEAIVAFRGTAPNEWIDDLMGAAMIETPQQVNALNWYRTVYKEMGLSDYYVTVIGHSKGGNKAKYIGILDETPDRIVSFDGQGFSDDFILQYREQILARRDKIENHNVDYDYVNILLNDIGKCYFYHGYDYGRGGFGESHCPNTFFDFADDFSYVMRLNPEGQSKEMKTLDRFMNSYVRSMPSQKEKEEASFLLGSLIQKGFGLKSSEDTVTDYINFLCEMVSDERYSDNVAFLFTFIIKYEKEYPGFVDDINDVMIYFNMTGLIRYVKMVRSLLVFPGLPRLIALADFVTSHISPKNINKIRRYLQRRFEIDMTPEQVMGMLSIVGQIRDHMGQIEIKDIGDDLQPDEMLELGDCMY